MSRPAPPDYALDVTDITVEADIVNVVTYAGGEASLLPKNVPGQSYAVDAANALPDSPTLGEIDNFYNATTPTSLSGESPRIDAAAFALTGAKLPAVRTLVIANDRSVTPSYQLLRVTFKGPYSKTRT